MFVLLHKQGLLQTCAAKMDFFSTRTAPRGGESYCQLAVGVVLKTVAVCLESLRGEHKCGSNLGIASFRLKYFSADGDGKAVFQQAGNQNTVLCIPQVLMATYT